jgi:hypothetical protein
VTVQNSSTVITVQPLARTESLTAAQRSSDPHSPELFPAPQLPSPITPVVNPVTVTEDVSKVSGPFDHIRIVPGSIADRVRAETVQSGHGVASDANFQHRQPQAVPDADKLKEQDYLLDRCILLSSGDHARRLDPAAEHTPSCGRCGEASLGCTCIGLTSRLTFRKCLVSHFQSFQ